MKIGILGYGSQAKRIIKILEKKKIKPSIIYKPTIKNNTPKFVTNRINDLKETDIIFICSPNHTHFKYINIFKKKYIFCEKPLVNNIAEFKKLRLSKNNKIFVNYNYRFGYLSEILSKRKKYKLGDLIGGNLLMCQGLATKKLYKESWRSKKNLCKLGVFEILGVHLIDTIAHHFKIKKINKKLINLSRVGNSFDTSYFQMTTENDVDINCMVSYFSPFISAQNLIFENGIIEMTQNSIQIRGPRDSFDKSGLFKTPPIIYQKKLKGINEYNHSMNKSIDYFLKIVKQKKSFNKNLLETSIQTNRFLLNFNN